MCVFSGKEIFTSTAFSKVRRGTVSQQCSEVRLSKIDAVLFQEADPREC